MYDTQLPGRPKEVGKMTVKADSWSWLNGDVGLTVSGARSAIMMLPEGREVPLRGSKSCPSGQLSVSGGFGANGVGLVVQATGQRVLTPAIEGIGEYIAACSSDDRWLLLTVVGGHD